jgi:glycosyltransferase involved in cell wall biosynthesis
VSNDQSTALVSIGLPTYNRATHLERAIASVLAQTHRQIELIVSDNASSDGTERLCREWSRRDNRLRYVRQPENLGPTANFHEVLAPARGQHFMWLSDDDWLDANYVSECLSALASDPKTSIAAGRCFHYDSAGRLLKEDVATNLRQPDVAERIVAYFTHVNYNSIFYGLMRTELVRRVGMRNALGSDWLVVVWMLLHGYATTVETTHVHRTVGGTSKSVRNIIKVLGLPRYQMLAPELTIALNSYNALLRMQWPNGADYETRRKTATRIRNILFFRRTKVRRFMPKALKIALINRFAAADAPATS